VKPFVSATGGFAPLLSSTVRGSFAEPDVRRGSASWTSPGEPPASGFRERSSARNSFNAV
jgi:hypothetical protein